MPRQLLQQAATQLTVPVAASTLLAQRLTGTAVEGVVLLTGRSAAYVRTPAGVLAVVATSAVAPSTSLVLPEGTAPQDVLPQGAPVRVGDGMLTVEAGDTAQQYPEALRWNPDALRPNPDDLRPSPVALRPTRWWDPTPVRPGRLDADALQVLTDALAGGTDVPADVVHARSAARRAAQSLVAGNPHQADAHLHSVLGFGPGTTPSGDDAAAGVLLAARALLTAGRGPAHVSRLADTLARRALARTGTPSQLMLEEARTGCGATVVVGAVNALAGHGDPRPAVTGLLRVGHHSGADIASGALALAQAVRAQAAA